MRRLTAAAALLGLLVPAGTSTAKEAPAAGEGSRCSAVVRARPGKFRNVQYRVRCTFEVTYLEIRSRRRAYAVQRRPRVDRPDPGDRFLCRKGRRYPRRVLCEGAAGAPARIVGAFRVNGDPCDGLRFSVRAFGGYDPDIDGPYVIPDVGLFADFRKLRPRGC
ncbi:MAG TPA: hypothetical protein VHG69_14160 [Thermoleophilaceae bacterium]|nr:hypothetical protein [Thermoleophilaceae bacterium]